jgi:hypothetical protein
MKIIPAARISLKTRMLALLRWGWASPWTLFGLTLGIAGLCNGVRIEWYRRTIVCYSGWIEKLLKNVPIRGGASALTLGHTILARSREDMLRSHPHEVVHVRQYELWGIFFVPAYFGISCWLVVRRKDPYWDNPFEREAYDSTSTRTTFRT